MNCWKTGEMKFKWIIYIYKGTLYSTDNAAYIWQITLTPYIVLPLFATRFADYAGGIRVSFI